MRQTNSFEGAVDFRDGRTHPTELKNSSVPLSFICLLHWQIHENRQSEIDMAINHNARDFDLNFNLFQSIKTPAEDTFPSAADSLTPLLIFVV